MILESVEIRPYCSNDMSDFKEMFCIYFRNDLRIEITDHEVESVCLEIAEHAISGSISFDILVVDERLVGFIIYQVDHPNSDWCEREGWGFIREIYIQHSMRAKGFGTKFVAHAETILYAKGAEHIYLTSDEAGEFWSLRGYINSGIDSAINHIPIYEK